MERATAGIRLSELERAAAPRGLYEAVLANIAKLERRGAAARAAALLATTFVSATLLFETLSYAAREFYLSGFSEYLDLLMTDHDAVLASWREFALSLAESLPALPLALFFAALFVLVWSLSRAVPNIRMIAGRGFPAALA